MESYFRYYHEQCAIVISENQQTAKTHRDMLRIVHQFTEQGSNFTETTLPVKDEEERYWMNFSVRILTMIDVGGLRQGPRLGQNPRTWTQGSLREFVSSSFPQSVLSDDVELGWMFNVRNLERVTDLRVIWTSNLADHLRLQDDEMSVRVFYHASFLELHREWYVQLYSSNEITPSATR
jgi:hypothetical protein